MLSVIHKFVPSSYWPSNYIMIYQGDSILSKNIEMSNFLIVSWVT